MIACMILAANKVTTTSVRSTYRIDAAPKRAAWTNSGAFKTNSSASKIQILR